MKKQKKAKPVKIPSDYLTYINIMQIATDIEYIVDQYDWNEYWADKELIKRAKAVKKAALKLGLYAESLMNVEYK